jgi:hypothetical protein
MPKRHLHDEIGIECTHNALKDGPARDRYPSGS